MSIIIEEKFNTLYMNIKKNNICMAFPLSPEDIKYLVKGLNKSVKTNIFIKNIDKIEEVMTGVNVHCNNHSVKIFIPNPIFREICRRGG